MANSLIVYHCPICGKRVFDATIDSVFHIEIKCPRCGKVVNIDSTPQPHHQALALLPRNNELVLSDALMGIDKELLLCLRSIRKIL